MSQPDLSWKVSK